MKSCPTCNRTFEDTWTFCLADGALLSAPFDPQATQRLPGARATDPHATEVLKATDPPPTQPARVAEDAVPTITAPPPPRADGLGQNRAPAHTERPRSKALFIWLIPVAAIAALVAFYSLSGRDSGTTAGNKGKPEATPSATVSESPTLPSPTPKITPQPTPNVQDDGQARAIENARAILGRNAAACQISKIYTTSAFHTPYGWRVRFSVVMAASGSPTTETLEWIVNESGEATPTSQLASEVAEGCP